MYSRKYVENQQEDCDQGFERTPAISQEYIVQPSNIHDLYYPFKSIEHDSKKKPSRYASQDKPGFSIICSYSELKGLDQMTKLLKKTQTFKKPNFRYNDETQQMDPVEMSEIDAPIITRKLKRLQPYRSRTNLQQTIEASIIKSKRAQFIENITMNTDNKERQNYIKEETAQHQQAQLVFKEKLPESTFSYFKKLMKSNQKSSFLQSKHNKALKIKMEKTKFVKEDLYHTQRARPVDNIQFSGDFQSGNLDFVLKITEEQFNAYLRIDTNTRGHQSWFYFKVSNNFNEEKRIKINVCNVKRRFKMIDSGQKIHVKEMNPNSEWSSLDQEVLIEPFGKKKYKLSFHLTLKPMQELMISLIPPYTYSTLLRDLQQFESSPNFKVDTLTHTITGLAVPLVTITKGASQKKRKSKAVTKKKLLLISGRIHPSQTCSSFIISGIIREIMQNEQHLVDFLSSHIIKIVPMLNPDGVIFGNFRTNYLGDDLNRSFHKCDEAVFPETTALKQLGRLFSEEYGQNFIGFLDMHGHSAQTNSFAYGPQYDQNSESFIQCRILPKIMDKMSKYFKYDMSEFKLQAYKTNTARGFFMKKLKVPSYTIETSYALYRDKNNQEENPKTMGIAEWKDYGREIARSILTYFSYLKAMKQERNIFKKGKEKKNVSLDTSQTGYTSCIDFSALRKEVQKQSTVTNKKIRNEQQASEDSDGESLEEDLTQAQKQILVKKIKEMTTPTIILPKVQKPSLNLPSVVPSMLQIGRSEEKITSLMPKLASKYRNKKIVRPTNLSYEYTQYLLKNISDLGGLRPQVLQFSPEGRKKGVETAIKKQSIIQF